MPYLAIINGIPTMVADDTPAPVAAPVEPIIYARPDDTIVLRPNKPLKVIFAKDAEVELEVREIEEEEEPVAEEPEPSSESEEETSGDLLEVVGEIHRHPVYTRYGGNLKTGEIFSFKKNNLNRVDKLVNVSLQKGCILSIGYVDGKRQQKYITQHQFIADCGKLKKKSFLHTKLKIDTDCESYKKRPFIRFYPLACLSYETEKGSGTEIKDITTAPAHRIMAKCKTVNQIDEYIAEFKEENAKLKRELARQETLNLAKDAHIQKLNDEINRLKDDNERYNEHSNKPLTAGAIQLQELLMTEHQGSTVLEMLQFCFKDITRNYPKANDEDYERSDCDADFGIFEMSPRGLSNRNEIITR